MCYAFTLPNPGSYYCYDNPAALQRTITTVMKVDNTYYNLLYSLYSWPNVILSLIGGVLIDRWLGVRFGAVLFSSFVCLGQVSLAGCGGCGQLSCVSGWFYLVGVGLGGCGHLGWISWVDVSDWVWTV